VVVLKLTDSVSTVDVLILCTSDLLRCHIGIILAICHSGL